MLTDQGGYMRNTKNILTLAFVIVLLIGSAVISASAQSRGTVRVVRRPVIVRPYYGYNWYWNRWNRWHDPFYNDFYFNDPYFYEQRRRYYLQEELNGDQRELEKHLKKYKADGVIIEKERKELDDDYSDIAKAKRKLAEFDRKY